MIRATVVALSLAALAACSAPAPAAPQLNVPLASEAAAAPAPSAPTGEQSERGNLIKKLGEPAAFGPTASGQVDPVVTFAVDKITVGAKCTSAYPQPAEHGNLVRVDLRAETAKTLPPDGFYMISGWDFSTVGADGITETQLVTGPAAMCLDESDMFHGQQFAPASKYRGSIVIDTKNSSGVLVLKPSFMMTTGGWEWEYGQA